MEINQIQQPKIVPFLWFDGQAEEAMRFYTSIFRNSRIERIFRKGPNGSVMSGSFSLDGQPFMALNGGPHFSFTPAISFFVNCQSQEEVDDLWDKLSEGGEKSRCGWLKDKFGVSWQIIPTVLTELLHDQDPEKSGRVMQAMLQMGKLDIQQLKEAHAGEPTAPLPAIP